MTSFHYTVSVVTAWLQSCETEEQVALFPSIIQRFIVERFSHKTEHWEIQLVCTNLFKDLERIKEDLANLEKRAVRAANGYESAVVGTYINRKGNLIHCLKSAVA